MDIFNEALFGLGEKLAALRGYQSDRFWVAFRYVLDKEIQDVQNEVNDLNINGDRLIRQRVRLKTLKDIQSGHLIHAFASRVEAELKNMEDKLERNQKKNDFHSDKTNA